MVRVVFTVTVELERTDGLFVSKDDLADEIIPEIEGVDPGSITPGDSEYEITSWSVERTA